MFIRNCIAAGDTTTSGGRIEPRAQAYPTTYDGRLAGFEGDPVWCPACNSFGVARCVKPFRIDRGDGGRQKLLDGDLCVCKCTSPPRLIGNLHRYAVAFSASEMARAQEESAGWLAYAGLTHLFAQGKSQDIETQTLVFVNSKTGVALSNRNVMIQAGGQTSHRITDHKGQLKVHVAPGHPADAHMIFESCQGVMDCEASNG